MFCKIMAKVLTTSELSRQNIFDNPMNLPCNLFFLNNNIYDEVVPCFETTSF